MMTKDKIMALVNARLTHVLLVAQAALPKEQFGPFRKIVLDQFGKSGLGKELERLFGNRPQQDR